MLSFQKYHAKWKLKQLFLDVQTMHAILRAQPRSSMSSAKPLGHFIVAIQNFVDYSEIYTTLTQLLLQEVYEATLDNSKNKETSWEGSLTNEDQVSTQKLMAESCSKNLSLYICWIRRGRVSLSTCSRRMEERL